MGASPTVMPPPFEAVADVDSDAGKNTGTVAPIRLIGIMPEFITGIRRKPLGI